MGDLEDSFPYSILRSTNIQLTEYQTAVDMLSTRGEDDDKDDL